MGFLFDTNVVSDNRRPNKVSTQFRLSIEAFDDEQTFISVLSLTEISLGIERQRRRDRHFKQMLDVWFEGLLAEFNDRTLGISAEIALIAGRLPCSARQPTYDALIAATALHHGHTVVTRNVRDFAPLGVSVRDPWQE